MRRLLLTLNLLIAFASSAFAVEAVTVVGPVKVTFSTNTVVLSDGLWTSYSPNIGYMTGKVGVGTSAPSATLDVSGTLNISSTAGTSGTIFSVSTGSVGLLTVFGSSININVPLVFPDGTTQSSTGISFSSITSSSNTWTANQQFNNKIGIGGAVDSLNKFSVISSDINTAIFNNTSNNTRVTIKAQTDASLVLNGNNNGASTVQESIIFLHNGSGHGIISADNADSNKFKIDNAASLTSSSGFVIDTNHRIGVGTSAPNSGVKMDIVGPVKISTATSSSFSFILTGSTNTGSTTNALGTNGPNSTTTPYVWLQVLIGTVTAYIPTWQ